MKEWGYLRENSAAAEKAGNDKHNNRCRIGLEKYLEVIFPNVDWIANKQFGMHNGKMHKIKPDYRSDILKLVIEFDGKYHYSNPINIKKDIEKDRIYDSAGYKVIRIPYFIQLTNKVVKQLFNVDVKDDLFPEGIESMSIEEKNTPAFMCPMGVKRMANDFLKFPEQYEANVSALKKVNDEFLTGVSILIDEYNNL